MFSCLLVSRIYFVFPNKNGFVGQCFCLSKHSEMSNKSKIYRQRTGKVLRYVRACVYVTPANLPWEELLLLAKTITDYEFLRKIWFLINTNFFMSYTFFMSVKGVLVSLFSFQ